MQPRNKSLSLLFDIIGDEKLSEALINCRAKKAIDGITDMKLVQDTFEKTHPDFKMDPAEKLSLDINDYRGNTLLILAIEKGYNSIVMALLNAKANPNISNTFGKTPLDEAVDKKNLFTVCLLLKHGALLKSNEAPTSGKFDKLFDFLTLSDQSNPDSFDILTILCNQLTTFLRDNPSNLKGFKEHKDLLNCAKSYLTKLKKLTAIHREKLCCFLNSEVDNVLYKDLRGMVAKYDAPLEGSRFRLFKLNEINSLLPHPIIFKNHKLHKLGHST